MKLGKHEASGVIEPPRRRLFRDDLIANEYLKYVQDQKQAGVPADEILSPSEFLYQRAAPQDDKRSSALRRIYDLLTDPAGKRRGPARIGKGTS